MKGSALVVATSYLSKWKYVYAGYCDAVSCRFASMASFTNQKQSAIPQLRANFLNQFIVCIHAG